MISKTTSGMMLLITLMQGNLFLACFCKHCFHIGGKPYNKTKNVKSSFISAWYICLETL